MVKKILVGLMISFFAASSFAFSVVPGKSKVTWKGAKVVGATHTGQVKIKEVDLKWKKGEISTGQVVIDMTTITNTDLKDKKWNNKLVGHLKSDDFFAVEKFKTATLKITKVKKASDKTYKLKGNLMIKGKKQPIDVTAEVTKSTGKMKTVKASFKFDRTKFGIKYGSGKFFTDLGDKMISDEVEVAVDLHFVKKEV